MTHIPNKPVFFSVPHHIEAVEFEINLFKKAIKGKKSLYIELTPSDVDQIVRENTFNEKHEGVKAYQMLVQIAHKAGLKVVPLDTDKVIKEYEPEITPESEKSRYISMYRREKAWEEKLRGTGHDSLVVMHPAHTYKIAQMLKIPDRNLLRLRNYREYIPPEDVGLRIREDRRISNKIAEEIERKRLERRKAKTRRGHPRK